MSDKISVIPAIQILCRTPGTVFGLSQQIAPISSDTKRSSCPSYHATSLKQQKYETNALQRNAAISVLNRPRTAVPIGPYVC